MIQRTGPVNSSRMFIGACLLAFLVAPARSEDSLASPVRDLTTVTGRSFGLVLGDLLGQKIQFKVDKPYRLEKAALPKPGPLDKWLELRRIETRELEEEKHFVYRIDLLYQLFPAIREAETRRIPGLPLRIFNRGQNRTVRTPDTRITVTPLIPGHIPDSEVTIRPAIETGPIPLDRHWLRIAVLCASLLIVLGYLAWRRDLLPLFRCGKSPFSSARREIAKLRKARPESPEFRMALQSVHRALNETAGEPVFACGLERFFAAHPPFEPMREKTTQFFALSQQVFFMQSAPCDLANDSAQWLEQLCSEFQKIERARR